MFCLIKKIRLEISQSWAVWGLLSFTIGALGAKFRSALGVRGLVFFQIWVVCGSCCSTLGFLGLNFFQPRIV